VSLIFNGKRYGNNDHSVKVSKIPNVSSGAVFFATAQPVRGGGRRKKNTLKRSTRPLKVRKTVRKRKYKHSTRKRRVK
jgi:hypothetical protein